jgi:hypothetical protein
MSYQRKQLSTDTDVGVPGPVPADLNGLADESLADIEKAVGHDAAEQLGYLDTGFFPVAAPTVPAGSVSQTQFRLAADDAAALGGLDAAATTLGGEPLIRWNSQVVLSYGEPWIAQIAAEAGLSDQDLQDLFTAAQSKSDPVMRVL